MAIDIERELSRITATSDRLAASISELEKSITAGKHELDKHKLTTDIHLSGAIKEIAEIAAVVTRHMQAEENQNERNLNIQKEIEQDLKQISLAQSEVVVKLNNQEDDIKKIQHEHKLHYYILMGLLAVAGIAGEHAPELIKTLMTVIGH